MSHFYMCHDSFRSVTWLIFTSDMAHSYVWHDSCLRVTWPVSACDMTRLTGWGCICKVDDAAQPKKHSWDMSHFYMWHDTFLCVTWLILTCDMTHVYVCHDSFLRVTWLVWQDGDLYSKWKKQHNLKIQMPGLTENLKNQKKAAAKALVRRVICVWMKHVPYLNALH